MSSYFDELEKFDFSGLSPVQDDESEEFEEIKPKKLEIGDIVFYTDEKKQEHQGIIVGKKGKSKFLVNEIINDKAYQQIIPASDLFNPSFNAYRRQGYLNRLATLKAYHEKRRDKKLSKEYAKAKREGRDAELIDTQANGLLLTYKIMFFHNKNVTALDTDIHDTVIKLLENAGKRGMVRFQFRLKFLVGDKTEPDNIYVAEIKSSRRTVFNREYETAYDGFLEEMKQKTNEYHKQGYLYEFIGINECILDIIIVPDRTLGRYFPTPALLVGKHCIINPDNSKQEWDDCIKWCYLAHMHPPINQVNRDAAERKYQKKVARIKRENEGLPDNKKKAIPERQYIPVYPHEDKAIKTRNPQRISNYIPFSHEWDDIFKTLTYKGAPINYPVSKDHLPLIEKAFNIEIWIVEFIDERTYLRYECSEGPGSIYEETLERSAYNEYITAKVQYPSDVSSSSSEDFYDAEEQYPLGSSNDPPEEKKIMKSPKRPADDLPEEDEEKVISPKEPKFKVFYVSKNHNKYPDRLNLLMYNGHLMLIRDVCALIRKKNDKNFRRSYPCSYCLHTFSDLEKLENHENTTCSHEIANEPNTKFPLYNFFEFDPEFHYKYILKCPYIIIYDFETSAVSLPDDISNNKQKVMHPISYAIYVVCLNDTDQTQSTYNGIDFDKPRVFRLKEGENPNLLMKNFFMDLEDIESTISILRWRKSKDSGRVDMDDTERAKARKDKNNPALTTCAYCGIKFSKDNPKVSHHSHFTGKYLALICNTCNVRVAESKMYEIPVFAHNARNFDSHIIIKYLAEQLKEGNNFIQYWSKKKKCYVEKEKTINIIPQNFQKYLCFSYGNLVFKDTLLFVQASLSDLIDTMAKDTPVSRLRHIFRHLSNRYGTHEDLDLALLCRKGVFPYSWLSDASKFKEKQLPPIEAFYDDLDKRDITQDEYKHAQKVWKAFHCNNFGDYHDLYLETDVLLLADWFESFRDSGIKEFGTDAANFISLPQQAWNTCLFQMKLRYNTIKHTIDEFLNADTRSKAKKKALQFLQNDPLFEIKDTSNIEQIKTKLTSKLESLTPKLQVMKDKELFDTIERNLRGGISYCNVRHAKANNPYLPSYDPLKPNTYNMYFDATSLYPKAMTFCLPCDNIKRMEFKTDKEMQKFAKTIFRTPDNAKTGYFVEYDINYQVEELDANGMGTGKIKIEETKNLHDYDTDYPFLVEKRKVEWDELSPEEKRQWKLHEDKPYTSTIKLVPTLYNKKHYMSHYMLLKEAVKHGLTLKRIHKVWSFTQKPFLRDFILRLAHLKDTAPNKVARTYFKGVQNDLAGKTIENVKRHMKLDLKYIDSSDSTAMLSLERILPYVEDRRTYDTGLVAFELMRPEVVLNKPTYIGFSVYDISKVWMLRFHYDVMKKRYKNKCRLCLTDTDSLIYWIETDDIYEDMESMKLEGHVIFGKTLGLFKDEAEGGIISECISLRSKLYHLSIVEKPNIPIYGEVKEEESENDYGDAEIPPESYYSKIPMGEWYREEFKDDIDYDEFLTNIIGKMKITGDGGKKKSIHKVVAKGIKRACHDELRKILYLLSLYEGQDAKIKEITGIRSIDHELYNYVVDKVALNNQNDKRYTLDNRIDALSYGHYIIKTNLLK